MKTLITDQNGLKGIGRIPMCLWIWGMIYLFAGNVVMGQEIDQWHNSLKPNDKAGSVLVLAEEGKVIIMDYDGTNRQEVYTGSYIAPHAFPTVSDERLLLLTNLGADSGSPNIYSLTLK